MPLAAEQASAAPTPPQPLTAIIATRASSPRAAPASD
jgi:hypothetical protein